MPLARVRSIWRVTTRPEQIEAGRNTPGFYTMMGVKSALGRDFLPEEGQPGKGDEVILFNRLWKRLGARPDIVGQQLRLNGEPYTVVGVLAPGPTDRQQGEVHPDQWRQVKIGVARSFGVKRTSFAVNKRKLTSNTKHLAKIDLQLQFSGSGGTEPLCVRTTS